MRHDCTHGTCHDRGRGLPAHLAQGLLSALLSSHECRTLRCSIAVESWRPVVALTGMHAACDPGSREARPSACPVARAARIQCSIQSTMRTLHPRRLCTMGSRRFIRIPCISQQGPFNRQLHQAASQLPFPGSRSSLMAEVPASTTKEVVQSSSSVFIMAIGPIPSRLGRGTPLPASEESVVLIAT